MKIQKISREDMINLILDMDFDSLDVPAETLQDILRNGCKGYNNMTDQELENIYNEGLEEDEKAVIVKA